MRIPKLFSTSFVSTGVNLAPSVILYARVDTEKPLDQKFTDIYETHYRRVFGLCRYLLNSADAAEDAVHEVFLRAKSKLSSYDGSHLISSWLLGIASHYCIDVLRRRGLESRLFESDSPSEASSARPSALTEMLVAERADAVRAALMGLPDKLRVPLTLAYYNELSYDEIAKLLGLTRSNVATLLFRARERMREQLVKEQ
jgi:RNA polymerase sigma-70 factor (ECF subfamily)